MNSNNNQIAHLCGAVLVLTIALTSCQMAQSSSGAAVGTTQHDTLATMTAAKKPYSPPSIPVMITSPQEKVAYVATHYWDNFPMSDTTYISEKNVMEQAFADYVYILSTAPAQDAKKGIGTLLDKAIAGERAMFDKFAELLEHYLYDPNSPLLNEDQYITVLEHIIAMDQLEDIEKYRPKHQLGMALKNRPTEKATNFSYKLRTGQSGTLMNFEAKYTLLYLFNPDCHACDEITEALKNGVAINRMLSEKRMRILAIYPDEDMELWEKHKHKLPQEWAVGYDSPRVILSKELYDLRASPTMLLLDKDKRVIRKDIRVDELEQFLRNL